MQRVFSGIQPSGIPTLGNYLGAIRNWVGMVGRQAFYDACFPRAEAAIAYCDKFPLDDMPDDAQRLLQLLYSLVMVSFPVEAWRQPNVPDSGAAYLDLVKEPLP